MGSKSGRREKPEDKEHAGCKREGVKTETRSGVAREPGAGHE